MNPFANMNATTAAGLFARGGALMGLIASVAGLAGWQLTTDQQEYISGAAGSLILLLWPLYEAARARSIAHKQQLATTLSAHGIPVPPPANKDIK